MVHPIKDKLKIREFYDASSSIYTQLYLKEQLRKYMAIPHDINVNARVILDVGCGPGLLNNILPINVYYVGLDISLKQLAQAKNNVNPLNSDLVYGDIDSPPFRPKSFENVYSITQIHHAPNTYKQLSILSKLSKNYVILGLLKKVFRDPTELIPEDIADIYDGGMDWLLIMSRIKLLRYLRGRET